MTMFSRRHLLASFAGALLVVLGASLPPSTAQAQSTATVTVRAIVAGNDGTGVEGALSSWSTRLQHQFAAYDSFSLHAQQTFTLTPGQPQTIDVPGQRTASIELISVTNGTYALQIQVPGGSTTVRMPPDQILFVGGPNVPGGVLILMVDS